MTFASLLLCCLIICLVLSGCTARKAVVDLPLSGFPIFVDESSKASLTAALTHHLHYLRAFPEQDKIRIGDYTVTYRNLTDSLLAFQHLITHTDDPLILGRAIKAQFHLLAATGRHETGNMLVTGYYEPIFSGSLTKNASFAFPLYQRPTSLIIRTNRHTGKTEIGRRGPGDSLLPYWTRSEIETGQLLQGRELVYLQDPLDAYLLQVQGSGRIRFEDGTIRAIRFAGSNGLTYRSLGTHLVETGAMSLEEVTIPRIRTYFRKHPDKLMSMLHHNPRYIFFRWGDTHGPKGSIGEILTPGRSIAVDQTTLPVGVVGYLESTRPVLDEHGEINHLRPFGRFVLPQDSGAAIKGAGRVDLFFGAEPGAEVMAGHMKEKGRLFFLLKKHFELP